MIFFKALVLAALIKLLLTWEKPFLCSGLYAGFALMFNLAFMDSVAWALVATCIAFVLASVYFWLLQRFEGAGLVWWVILFGGLVTGLV